MVSGALSALPPLAALPRLRIVLGGALGKGNNAVRKALAGIVLTLAFVSAASAAGAPELGYSNGTNTVVADGAGAVVRTFPELDRFSLGGSLFAAEREGKRHSSERVVGFDLSTGEKLFSIRNAIGPVVPATGGKVVFLPTFRREPYVRSLWMRDARGRVRKIAQFKAPGVDGIPHGMGGDGSPLDVALDARARRVAITFGLEPLRMFDVWVVDTRTGEAARMTRGENSHNPSLSPDGEQVAVRVERPEGCPDPLYGEILIGKIRVIASTGETRDLTEWDCDLFFDTPRWVDDDTLVAVRVTKDATEELGYDLDLVRIDAASGTITDLLTEGNPCCVTASPSLGKLAYVFSDRPGFAVLDLTTGEILDVGEDVSAPRLSGEGRL